MTRIFSFATTSILAYLSSVVLGSIEADSSSNPLPIQQEENSHFLRTSSENHRELQSSEGTAGPWEICLGMQAEDCVDYIESQASDVYAVVVYPEGSGNFNYDRILIRVNGMNQVVRAPARG